MREIKFRAWDGRDMQTSDGYGLEGFFAHWSNNSDWPLMQYTGLNDKNGVEIFEGDIIGGYPHGTIEVRWCKEYACFESHAMHDIGAEDGGDMLVAHDCLLANDLKECDDEWTVIGNIHQNPELLEG